MTSYLQSKEHRLEKYVEVLTSLVRIQQFVSEYMFQRVQFVLESTVFAREYVSQRVHVSGITCFRACMCQKVPFFFSREYVFRDV